MILIILKSYLVSDAPRRNEHKRISTYSSLFHSNTIGIQVNMEMTNENGMMTNRNGDEKPYIEKHYFDYLSKSRPMYDRQLIKEEKTAKETNTWRYWKSGVIEKS